MKLIKKILLALFIFLFITLLRLPLFVQKQFGVMEIEQIIFVVLGNNTGANYEIVLLFCRSLILNAVLATIIYFLVSRMRRSLNEFDLNIEFSLLKKGKRRLIQYKNFGNKLTVGVITFSLLFITLFYNESYKVSAYIRNQSNVGTLYEEQYVDPTDVKIEFPDKKKNLIYIIVESLNTNFNSMLIDDREVNLIPELENLANENINFSHTEGFGGHEAILGTTWTMGSLVGQTSGVPLSGPLGRNKYGGRPTFLPGIKTIGEILADNGYKNYLSIGSDANFAGRDVYFSTHGDYTIYDLMYWREEGRVPDDYNVFWGIEDEKLFEYSKEKLLEIAAQDEPFNFSMLTVDSHYVDGYTDQGCELPYETVYANAIECSDSKVVDFVNWIKEQDFYKDTVVVLVADHPTMNNEFLGKSLDGDNNLYNAFLNTDMDESVLNTTLRQFSVVDLFPTTLGALGVDIEGNRLGLGSNLFSDEKTLLEKMGATLLDEELALRSKYYIDNFHRFKEEE